MERGFWQNSPLMILLLGTTLFVVAVAHHAGELLAMDGLSGPVTALFLDGLPALGLVYAGYWLQETDLAPRSRRTVLVWCLSGAVAFSFVTGSMFLVLFVEGRRIPEPLFPMLIAMEAGALAGLVAGYFNARSRSEARRARTVTEALAFVNDLIRHDLRNDLAVIQGHIDLLESAGTPGDPDEAGGDLSVVADTVEEALMRIEVTRAVADTLTGGMDVEPVDLAAITAELAGRVERTYDVTVTTELPDRLRVRANAGLRSIVDNLLENAAEHNDADEPRIDVAIESDTHTARLIVRDNGPGIPDSKKASLFDVRRGAESGGLVLVRTLVERYGGKIWVEDNEPRGSVFVVELPRVTTGLADGSSPVDHGG